MKKTGYFICALLLLCMTANAEWVFVYEIAVHKNDTVDLKDFELIEGKVNTYPSNPGEYTLKIISSENKEVFTTAIPIQFSLHVDEIGEDGKMHQENVELDYVTRFMRLPYSISAEKIELYHGDMLINSLRIGEKLCISDGTCIDYCKSRNDPDCPHEASTTISSTETTSFTETLPTTTPSEATTTIPDEAGSFDIISYLPQITILIVVLAVLGTAVFTIRRRAENKRIERERKEFRK